METEAATCQEDEVSLLSMLGLKFDEAFQVWSLTGLNITLVIREELHQMFLLIGRQKVQQPHSVSV